MSRFATRLITFVLFALTVTTAAHADAGDWMVRLRATGLVMTNASDAGSGALTPTLLPEDAISVNNKVIPDLNVSYFFTKNLAAELVLTYPQEQTVSIEEGPLTEEVGTFKHLPPTLTLQWHFLPDGKVQPYVGAGVNFTLISDVSLRSDVAAADLGLDDQSIGAAFQAGADVPLQKNWYFNVDVKKVFIRSAVTVAGNDVSQANLDPFLIGAGVGIRF